MGVIYFLAHSPSHAVARGALDVDLGHLPCEPHRGSVGRRTENDLDVPLMCGVKHREEPLKLEDAILGLPGRPDRFADTDNGEPCILHLAHIGLESRAGLILMIVGGAKKYRIVKMVHGILSCNVILLKE